MQKIFVLITAFLIFLLALPSLSNAEKIYYKNGKIIKGIITSRSKGTIWLRRDEGVSTGVTTKDISKIENEDGSISKYDYARLEKMIRECIAKEQYADAARLCDIFLEGLPGYIRMRYLRGGLNQKLGNLKEAAEDYDFLINHMVADAKVYNNRGIISAKSQEFDEAMDFFSKAISKDPSMAAAHSNLANLLLQKKEYDKAIEEYKKLISMEPNNIEALYNLGVVYADAGDYKMAEKQWKKILSIEPDNKDAKKALGIK